MHRSAWDPAFGVDDPWFASVRVAADRLRGFDRWPTVAEIDAALRDLAPVRFEKQPPKPRRARDARRDGKRGSARAYDERIVLEGVVPTRESSWHDLLNALVWASFPNAKSALHRRQYAENLARGGLGCRSRAQDWLTMLDEGGAIAIEGSEHVFGHALLEHRLARLTPRPRVIALDGDHPDRALARWLDDGHC